MIKFFHQFVGYIWIASLLFVPYLLRERFNRVYSLYLKVELPSMLFTIGLGIILLMTMPEKLKMWPFHMKLTAVAGLVACDLVIWRWTSLFAHKGVVRSKRATYTLQVFIILFLIMLLAGILLGKKP